MQGFNYLLPLITLPYLVRVLGPDGYGALGFSLACIQYVIIVSEYGFNLSASKSIAQKQSSKIKVSYIFWNVTAAKLTLSLSSCLILILLTNTIPVLFDLRYILYCCLTMVVGNLLFPIWLLQGLEKMEGIALANILAKAVVLPLTFIFVQDKTDAWIAALLQGVASIGAGIICLVYIYKSNMIKFMLPTRIGIKKQLIDGLPLFTSSIAISVYTSSVPVILGFAGSITSVGYFVAADKIRLSIQGLIAPISQAIYPRVSNLINNTPRDALIIIKKTIVYFGSFMLSLCLFTLGFSTWIIQVAYGENYSESVNILRILALIPLITFISQMLAVQIMIPLGMSKEFSKIIIRSSIISTPLIFIMSSLYGNIGASSVVLLIEFAIFFQFARLLTTSHVIRKKFL